MGLLGIGRRRATAHVVAAGQGNYLIDVCAI